MMKTLMYDIAQELFRWECKTLHTNTVDLEMDSTYRYILYDFFACNNSCRYTLSWINRIFRSSIPNCSNLTAITKKIGLMKFYKETSYAWGVEEEVTRTYKLTKACKFSNFFIELAWLGSDVCGQGDTIRASFLWGSACLNN